MLGTRGFGWDKDRNSIKVDSEDVWTNYVKAHPTMKHYREKVIVNWVDLGTLFGHDKATGATATIENEAVNDTNVDDFAGKESYSCGNRADYTITESQPPPKKNSTSSDVVAGAIFDSIAKSPSKTYESTSPAPISAPASTQTPTPTSQTHRETAANVWGDLSVMSELGDIDKLRAVDLLSGDELKYAIFMTIPRHLRKTWLLMQFKG